MTALLEVDGVTKRFGGVVAVNDLSFGVERGESVGLVGPNGAGKTTIFSLVMGEHRQDTGRIQLDGRDISREPTYARINRGVSRTYQVPRPFSDMTVAQNIRVGMMPNSLFGMIGGAPDLDEEIAIARSVGFKDADIQRTPAELAMGDLRRLELARTLATRPSVMLLDEVFAGLTVGEIAQISELLGELREQGMTFVIVSHDLPALEPLVDRVVAMTFGTAIKQGSFADVMADDAVRAAYLGH